MRLVNAEYGMSIKFMEDKPSILVIEQMQMRLKIVEELHRQCLGEVGNFVLSDDEKIVKIQKAADMLLSPFGMDCNNRKVLTKLYQEIQECGNADFYNEKVQINSEILLLLDKIMGNVPYNISTALDFDWVELCKLYNVQLEKTGDTLLERLMDYIRAMAQLCACKVFILLNFMMYLEKEELEYLYEFAAYQKIYLLFIEYFQPVFIGSEKVCIIDKDNCIIEIENNNLQHLPSDKFGENQKGFEV